MKATSNLLIQPRLGNVCRRYIAGLCRISSVRSLLCHLRMLLGSSEMRCSCMGTASFPTSLAAAIAAAAAAPSGSFQPAEASALQEHHLGAVHSLRRRHRLTNLACQKKIAGKLISRCTCKNLSAAQKIHSLCRSGVLCRSPHRQGMSCKHTSQSFS